jgi:hypothetical protein
MKENDEIFLTLVGLDITGACKYLINRCWIAGLLDCWIAGLPDCWIAGLPD